MIEESIAMIFQQSGICPTDNDWAMNFGHSSRQSSWAVHATLSLMQLTSYAKACFFFEFGP